MSARGLDETHDPSLRSFVASANDPASDFPIQNLPFGVFRRVDDPPDDWRGGVAIGDKILDLRALYDARAYREDAAGALELAARSSLNEFAAAGRGAARTLRHALSHTLRDESPYRARLDAMLVPAELAVMTLPVRVGDYTDFYASKHHASAVGALFRPEQPLLPNYAWVPIGYHGRASSIVVSGTPIRRPNGQTRAPGDAEPSFGPSRRLDYELELGIVVGRGNELGAPIPIDEAEEHVFGLCLLNDWSARDVQAWEYQPLGPFLGKSFATTISPWIVTLDALEPYRTPLRRAADDPAPLPYLAARDATLFDVGLTVAIATRAMRERHEAFATTGRSNAADAFWTPAQLVAHHASNGCNLRPGDLLGTGTLSGPSPDAAGSLLERTDGGRDPIDVGDERRRFLEDGDAVAMHARSAAEGRANVGFGQCTGVVAAGS